MSLINCIVKTMLKTIPKDVYVIFGPIGSGKTTQAVLLSRMLNLKNVSWGNIYRQKSFEKKYKNQSEIIKNKNIALEDRSKSIAKIIEREMIKVDRLDCRGMVIDGFPRRLDEAKLFWEINTKLGFRLKALICINPALESCLKRLAERMLCPKCGRHYDEVVTSKFMNRCDEDGEVLIREYLNKSIIKQDFISYFKEVLPATEYLLPNAESSFSVCGDLDPAMVFSEILTKLRDGANVSYTIFERKTSTDNLHTKFGTFKMVVFQSKVDYSYNIALVKGDVKEKTGVLTRVHSSCITGDIFGSGRCDCGDQLHEALRQINVEGGVLIYLFQEGRGINLINKIGTYSLQDDGLDTVEANKNLGLPPEMRQYNVVREILDDLGVVSVRLLTNNPDKINKLTSAGVVIEEMVPLETRVKKSNKRYLLTKKEKMGHKLSIKGLL